MALTDPNFADERAWLIPVLTEQIPLGRAMRLDIVRLDADGIALRAPLAPNVNDKGTAFGGALASLMILAGWSLPRLLLRRHGLRAELVIGRCQVRFLAPVREGFRAECAWPEPPACEAFFEGIGRNGRGKLELAPEIRVGETLAARLEARYAGLVTAETGHGDEP